jgi:hypothetical protein
LSDEPQDPAEELKAARARIARLEQEAETNRAFFARSLAEASLAPPRGGRFMYGVMLLLGFAGGVLVSVALMVASSQPTAMAPMPPERREVVAKPVVVAVVADAGAAVQPAPAPAPAPTPAVARPQPAKKLDESGSLNVTATAAAVVFIDGRKVGAAPVQGQAVAPGAHVVKVVCSNGTSSEKKVDVPAFAEVDVEQRCE